MNALEVEDIQQHNMGLKDFGRREKVICGRISRYLFDSIHSLIGTERFQTVNDFVEEAVFEKWKSVTDERAKFKKSGKNN